MLSNTDEAKNRILECAARLFADNGVHSTSLADISQAAQVSKGTLYYHYSTKDKLIFEVCDLHMNHMKSKTYAWLESVREDSSAEAVLNELLDILTDDIFHVKLHIALCSEASLDNEQLQALIKERYFEMGLIIDLAAIRLNTSLHKMPNMKEMFFMALDGLMLHSLMGLNGIDRRLLIERIYN